MLNWIARNLSTLILAFILAVVVWVSAVLDADPNRERTYTRSVELLGQHSDMVLIGDVLTQVRVTVRAPESILSQLSNSPNLIEVWVDLSGLEAGNHELPVLVSVERDPHRVASIEPRVVEVQLDERIVRQVPVMINLNGEPALGYRKGTPDLEPAEVSVSGPESTVEQVEQATTSLDIFGANETVQTTVTVNAMNANGDPVDEVTITPRVIDVTVPITLLGGYRTVAIKPETVGQPAPGYRLTHISVSPPTVTVFSSNPQLVNELPGYVETNPMDITGITDDVEIRMDLNLPDGMELVGDPSVLVQVGVAAIEGSLTLSLPVETLGLPPELQASIAPTNVDLIVSGPLPVLDTLSADSFRVVVDLGGLEPGVYQLAPVIDLIPGQVSIDTILPETVEVTVREAGQATSTGMAVTAGSAFQFFESRNPPEGE